MRHPLRTPPGPATILVVAGLVGALAAPGAAVTITFDAAPLTVASGAAATLSWSTTGATGCVAEGGWDGARPTTGTEPVTPHTTTTYRLRCEGPLGVATREVTVAVKGDDCEAIDTCTIESPSRSCLFPLSVAADGIVRVTVRELDPALAARWRIVTAAGTAAPSCGTLRAGESDCGPLPAGTYTIQVSAASGTGSATVHRQHLTGCAATALDCEQEVHDTIVAAGDVDLFRFATTADERVRITVRELGGTIDLEWRLLTAAGTRAAACDTFRRSLSEDCGPLGAGDHVLQVRDERGDRTGPYAVHLHRLSAVAACDATDMLCDQTRAGEIQPGTDADLFRFAVEADEVVRVVVDERVGPLVAEWRLLRLDGAPAPACGAFTTARAGDCGPLPAGTYQIQVKDDVSRRTGTYEVSLFNLVHVCANCGNGIVTDGEECDPPGVCCTADCRFATAGTVCRPVAGVCDVAETCTGTSGVCPVDTVRPAGTLCRAATDLCDAEERCSGLGPFCPPDALAPAGTECRPAAGVCDALETCTGLGPACPLDAKRTTICRPPAGGCDVAERCDGSSDHCPADRLAIPGSVCRPAKNACDVEERCPGGTPACPVDALTPLQCGDGCLDPREHCGEPGTEACAAHHTCVGCVCVPCTGAAPACEVPDTTGAVTVRLGTEPSATAVDDWAGTLAWDPARLRLDAVEAAAPGLPAPVCTVDADAGTASCTGNGAVRDATGDRRDLARARFVAAHEAPVGASVEFVLHDVRDPAGGAALRCPAPGACLVPECDASHPCDDDNACTDDACEDGRCTHTPRAGFEGTDCELARLLDSLACDGAPLDGRLRTSLMRRIAKARRLLRKAAVAEKPRRIARLFARANRLLDAAERRATQSRRVDAACGERLGALVRERRGLVAALRGAP